MATNSIGNNVTTSIAMEPELYEQAKARADALRMSFSRYIRELTIADLFNSGPGGTAHILAEEVARPVLPQEAARLQRPIRPELEAAVRAAERVVDKARKHGSKKK